MSRLSPISDLRSPISILGVVLLLGACGVPPGPSQRIGVPPGSSLSAVSESLAVRGVIGNARWFRLRGRLAGVDRTLKPGIYEFTPGTSTGEILDRLARGDDIRFRVTLPEGGTLRDLARSAETRLGIPRDSVHAAARNPVLLGKYGIAGPNVEGWLLPQTFDFGGYATAAEVVDRFLAARRDAWPPDWRQRANAADLDQADILSLASIVEAEARLPEELPLVAAVYRNRLRLGMPLQADPTIQYAFLIDSGARKPRLFNQDYAYPSPYNTYLHSGLPPTPVGNPSAAAVDAVLSPADVRYLYFVARGDGGHVFSRTYREHLNAIRRIRQ